MSRYWTFRDFVVPSGENVIRTWLHSLPVAARAKIQARIQYLEVTAALEPQYVKALKGNCAGLIELRIVFKGMQYRPVGCHGPGDREITLLIGAIERGGRFEPHSACSTGLMRKAQIHERGRTCEHDFS
jgi:hypothetical protein